MRLKQALLDKKFDTRMIEKNLRRGVITNQEVESVKGQLSDDAGNAKPVDLTEPDPAYPHIKGPVMVNGRVVSSREFTPGSEGSSEE